MTRKLTLVVLLWSILLVLSGCYKQQIVPNTPETIQSVPGWVKNDPKNNTVIVFVHGVIGNFYDTWLNSQTNAYWPKLIEADSVFSKANVYAYEYQTHLLGNALDDSQLASEMKARLQGDGVLSHQEIIFVVHSMGGIVTRQFLLRYREDVAHKIRMIYFLGTPTMGSPVATLASHFSLNPQFNDMTPVKLDSYLTRVMTDWLASKQMRAIPSYCSYETQTIGGAFIVPVDSATNLCNRELLALPDDHSGIAKPKDKNAMQYIGFKNAFRETDVNRIPCGPQQNDHPIIEFSYAMAEQVQFFPEDKVKFLFGEGAPKKVWLGYAWQDFQFEKEYTVAGTPGQPVTPKFEPDINQGGMKLEVSFCRFVDRPRDLRSLGGLAELAVEHKPVEKK